MDMANAYDNSIDLQPPRDLIGYGPNPPNPHWPNNAKIALSFVINYEEGGEYSLVNGDTRSETYLSEIVGGLPRHGARNTNIESEYEYGSRAGIWRLLRLFGDKGVRGTVFGVGRALELNPEVGRVCAGMGWEVGCHGWRWIDYHDVPETEERAQIERCIDLSMDQTGRAPTGWYVGRLSPRSQLLILEMYRERGLELLWMSDSYADDLPYYQSLPQLETGLSSRDAGAGGDGDGEGRNKALLILPYSLDTNDFKYLMPHNWSSPDDFYNYLVAAFDELYAEGVEGSPKMMSVGLHARISGRPGRIGAVRKFVEYIRQKEGVWVATREEIARYWLEVHPYKG
ncbi:hypothetical protein LTR78_002643 [Recurvomyces mirabilis]|uniref:NodB homology domain-containing protein n=1 Tax=Recurvomyces mirabilis TaxID=574656 RepID=A0AAE0WU11_9PEZI|nr:hypothetical protein LTR78_002643 [Recurvomyces mirabilis]KAK5157572.1 hypothetical protein LTS14_004337 [Recurvomyces mirabilis]